MKEEEVQQGGGVGQWHNQVDTKTHVGVLMPKEVLRASESSFANGTCQAVAHGYHSSPVYTPAQEQHLQFLRESLCAH